MDFATILEWIIKSLIVVLSLTAGFAYTTLYERKVLARMQVRVGPNRAGPLGILQPVADGIKLIFKEDLIPAEADKFIFVLAPIITVIPALVMTAVVPWGGTINLFGRDFTLQLADINVGVLWILSVTSISVYGISLAGWSSPACGKPRSAVFRYIFSTQTFPVIQLKTDGSPARYTEAIANSESSRKSSWASAACAPCRRLASSLPCVT